MEVLFKIIGFLALLFLFGYIIFDSFRLLYNRHLRTYKKDIRAYLFARNFELLDTFSPNDEDWKKSPFQKPSKFEISFFYTTPLRWSKTEYLKILGCRNDKYQEFWLEIYTSYFRTPKLTFKEGVKIKKKYIDSLHSESVIEVKEKCLACGCELLNNENKCPACGLCFD